MNRAKRDFLLLKTDFFDLSDSPLSLEEREEVRVYRQALRDIVDEFPAVPNCLSKAIRDYQQQEVILEEVPNDFPNGIPTVEELDTTLPLESENPFIPKVEVV
jgi:hypothetical protein